MPSDTVKLVLVANMATNMGVGRVCAQCCHAAVLTILEAGEWVDTTFQIATDGDPTFKYWMQEGFTKVVVKVWGEEELLALKIKAESLGLRTALMVEDDGQCTALSIGPAETSKLNPVTRDLLLL